MWASWQPSDQSELWHLDASWYVLAKFHRCLLFSHEISTSARFVRNIFCSNISCSSSSIIWKAVNFARIYAGATVGLVDLAFCVTQKLNMSWKHAADSPSKERFHVGWSRSSNLADYRLADLELGRLYVKDLRSLCSRLNLATTGVRPALIKRIEEAQRNTANLSGTSLPIQDGSEHVENQNDQNALELQFHRQVRQLLDRESSQDGLLSSAIYCTRVTKRGNWKSRISRRSRRS